MSAALTADSLSPTRPPKPFQLIQVAYALRPFALDFVATLFFAGLFAFTHNLLLATGVGVAIGLAQVGWGLATRRPVAAMQWAGLGLVVATAAIANVTHSPLVVMLKPSLIYGVIGAAMLQPGWMARYAVPMARSPIPPVAYIVAGYFVAALMLVSSGLNAYFALATDLKTWTAFVAIFPLASKLISFGLVGAGFTVVARHNKRRGIFFPGTAHRADTGLGQGQPA